MAATPCIEPIEAPFVAWVRMCDQDAAASCSVPAAAGNLLAAVPAGGAVVLLSCTQRSGCYEHSQILSFLCVRAALELALASVHAAAVARAAVCSSGGWY